MAYSVKRLEAFSDWLFRGVVTTKTKIIKVFDLPEFDAAEYLDSADDIAACLTTVLEENDAALLAAALGYIARAKGMTSVARDADITREALYKALRPGSAPRFDTVSRVCAALGVCLEEGDAGQRARGVPTEAGRG